MKKYLAMLLAVVMLLSVLSGCGGNNKNSGSDKSNTSTTENTDKKDEAEEKVLTIALPSTIQTLNPMKITNEFDAWVVNNVCEPLIIGYGMGSEYMPGVAESWTMLDDTTMELKIRDGVYWHSDNDLFKGEKVQVKAPEIKEIVEYYMNPDNGYVGLSGLKVFSEVIAVDDFTLQIKTSEPYALLEKSVGGIKLFPMKAVEEGWDINKHPIGSGAYIFESYAEEDEAVLVKNSEYWLEPNLDRVVFKIVPDGSTMAMALLNDEIDIASQLTSNTFIDLVDQDDITLELIDMAILFYVGVNCSNPLFEDVEIRRALQMAIDREAVVKTAYENEAGIETTFLGHGPITPPMPGHDNETWEKLTPKYDPEGAMKIIESKGWVKNEDGIYEKDGQTFTFKIQAAANQTERMKTATMVSTYLRQIGVDAICAPTEAATLSDDLMKPTKECWLQGGSSGLNAMQSLVHSTKANKLNTTYYSNPECDALIEEAFRTLDFDARSELLRQAACMAAEDAIHLLDCYSYVACAFNNKVTDFSGLNYLGLPLCCETRNIGIQE